jgi:NADH dehydrogenase
MRAVVLGAGYAGLLVARSLEDRLPDDVDLVVVDEYDAHLVQHELHRVLRRPDLADELTVPLDTLLDQADFRQGRVEGVDPDERRVTFADGDHLDYDVAAVCLGAATEFHGLPGVAEHATPFKRLRHAHAVRERFLDVVDAGGTAVVGGAGLSGIQVAGELAALNDEEGTDVTVRLVERLDAVAPGFPENFQSAVRDELDRAGVAVETGVRVGGADADAIHTADAEIPYDQFVWTGGIRGPDALGGERAEVTSTLALDDRTFVVGDAAKVVDAEGSAVPASAQAAVREARTAATNVVRVVEGERDDGVFRPRLERFTFDSRGWLVSVGDGAVAQVGPTVLTGSAARTVKAGVGASYLASAGAIRDALDLAREEVRGGHR